MDIYHTMKLAMYFMSNILIDQNQQNQQFKKLFTLLQVPETLWNKSTDALHGQNGDEINVLAVFYHNPRISIHAVETNSRILKWFIHKIIKKNKLRLYKPSAVHKLFSQDFGPRIDFALWVLDKVVDYSSFVHRLMITDECMFYTNGMVSNQISRMWVTESPIIIFSDPHWIRKNNNQYQQSVIV